MKLAIGTQVVSWMFGFVPACLMMYTPLVLMELSLRSWALILGWSHSKALIQRDVEHLLRLTTVILKTGPMK